MTRKKNKHSCNGRDMLKKKATIKKIQKLFYDNDLEIINE